MIKIVQLVTLATLLTMPVCSPSKTPDAAIATPIMTKIIKTPPAIDFRSSIEAATPHRSLPDWEGSQASQIHEGAQLPALRDCGKRRAPDDLLRGLRTTDAQAGYIARPKQPQQELGSAHFSRSESGPPTLRFEKAMVAGAVSRSIAQTFTLPLDSMKTMLQAGVAGRQLSRQPLRLLARGAGAQFLLSVPVGALTFGSIEVSLSFPVPIFIAGR